MKKKKRKNNYLKKENHTNPPPPHQTGLRQKDGVTSKTDQILWDYLEIDDKGEA